MQEPAAASKQGKRNANEISSEVVRPARFGALAPGLPKPRAAVLGGSEEPQAIWGETHLSGIAFCCLYSILLSDLSWAHTGHVVLMALQHRLHLDEYENREQNAEKQKQCKNMENGEGSGC